MSRHCDQCGRPIRSNAAHLVCPYCLAGAVRHMLAGTDPGSDMKNPEVDDESSGISGIRIPGYDLIRITGEGGMGVVYEAWQQSTNRKVALKMMKGSRIGSERLRLRFEREVGIAVLRPSPTPGL